MTETLLPLEQALRAFHSPLALALGFLLDQIMGDPHGFPHIVCAMGRCISSGERFLRSRLPALPRGELIGGAILALWVTGLSLALPAAVLWGLYRCSFWLGLGAEAFLCCQLIAVKALKDESLPVYEALQRDDLPAARKALSMIVGRDTQVLDREGVIKAAVETVAENSSDGAAAPLLWMGLFGVWGGLFCKALNTMDSMIAYKNSRYLYFGRAAARLDDAVNFIPARIAGLLTVLAAFVGGFDGKNALKIFLRDRLKHESPNSAHTESAMAGALRLQLAGPAQYEGVMEDKPFLGDRHRPIEPGDILRSHRVLFIMSFLAFFCALALRVLLCAPDGL